MQPWLEGRGAVGGEGAAGLGAGAWRTRRAGVVCGSSFAAAAGAAAAPTRPPAPARAGLQAQGAEPRARRFWPRTGKSRFPGGNRRGSAAGAGRELLAHSRGKLAWVATPHRLSAPFSRRM